MIQNLIKYVEKYINIDNIKSIFFLEEVVSFID
jgi:hypothetical protein